MTNIIEITDFNAPELDIYARLKENQLQHYFEPAPDFLLQKAQTSLNVPYIPGVSLILFS